MGPRSSVKSSVDEEVTRVEQVSYLEGASGHGVLSLLFLVGAVVLVRLGVRSGAVMAVIVAYGVALNGLSIWAWDRLREAVVSVVERGDDAPPARTLTPHRISTEMKAELVAGLVMVGGFVAFLGAVSGIVQLVSVRTTVYLFVGALAAGDLAALGWMYYASPRR